jgi:hypothetical protein
MKPAARIIMVINVRIIEIILLCLPSNLFFLKADFNNLFSKKPIRIFKTNAIKMPIKSGENMRMT